jgi:peptide/nickel transport system permease protein
MASTSTSASTSSASAEPRSGSDALLGVAGDGAGRRRVSMWRVYMRSKGAVVGACILGLLVLASALGSVIEPYDPIAVAPHEARGAPSAQHLMGTDQYGRDVFSRVIAGSRISLAIGFFAVIISVAIGTFMGLIAGYSEGVTDGFIMRLIDMQLAFPGILLALAIVAALGASTVNVVIAVGISTIPVYARVVRGTVLTAKREAYIDAGRVIGCSAPRLLLRHILPNVIAPVLVLATIGVAYSILNGSALSFLGLGVQPPGAEWGLMISDGRNYLNDAWWMTTFPGLALALVVLSINLVGDGLRDTFDPRTRRR